MSNHHLPPVQSLPIRRYSTSSYARAAKARRKPKNQWHFSAPKVIALNASGLLFGLQLGLVLTGTSIMAASLGALAMGCFNLSVLMTCRQ